MEEGEESIVVPPTLSEDAPSEFRRILSSLASCLIRLLSRLALISLAGSHALIA